MRNTNHPQAPNQFTHVAEVCNVGEVNFDELYIYTGRSVADIADALEEHYTDQAADAGLDKNGLHYTLLMRALGAVNWYALATSMFVELTGVAEAFRFDVQFCPPEKMLPADTTHMNPREYAKENGYTVRGDYMSDADGNMLFFVLVFPED